MIIHPNDDDANLVDFYQHPPEVAPLLVPPLPGAPIVWRSQNDGMGDLVSLATGQVFHPDDQLTRQEFKEDADINSILRRHGVLPAPLPFVGGSTDFDLDLTTAYQAVQEARQTFDGLPASIRSQFPNWEALAAHLAASQPSSGGDEVPSSPPDEVPPGGKNPEP